MVARARILQYFIYPQIVCIAKSYMKFSGKQFPNGARAFIALEWKSKLKSSKRYNIQELNELMNEFPIRCNCNWPKWAPSPEHLAIALRVFAIILLCLLHCCASIMTVLFCFWYRCCCWWFFLFLSRLSSTPAKWFCALFEALRTIDARFLIDIWNISSIRFTVSSLSKESERERVKE